LVFTEIYQIDSQHRTWGILVLCYCWSSYLTFSLPLFARIAEGLPDSNEIVWEANTSIHVMIHVIMINVMIHIMICIMIRVNPAAVNFTVHSKQYHNFWLLPEMFLTFLNERNFFPLLIRVMQIVFHCHSIVIIIFVSFWVFTLMMADRICSNRSGTKHSYFVSSTSHTDPFYHRIHSLVKIKNAIFI